MKTKVVLSMALLIFITLGGLSELPARKAPSTKEGHTWAEDRPTAQNVLRPSYENSKKVVLFISFSKIPFVIYVNILSAPNIGCQDPKEIPIKKGKNDGASKNFRRY